MDGGWGVTIQFSLEGSVPRTHHNVEHILRHGIGVDLSIVITIFRCVVAGEPADGVAALAAPPPVVGLLQDEDPGALGQR